VLRKTKKISKKEIQQDTLITYYSKALEFVDAYSKQLMIGIGVFAVVVVAIVIYQNKMEEENIAAATALSRIIPNYAQKNYQNAIEGQPGTDILGLKSIVENYGSSTQGEVAKLYLANSYYYTGQIDAALDVYSDITNSEAMIRAAAFAGKGACFVEKNNFAEAASNYEKAAHVSKYNALNSSYLLKAGINYIKAKDYETAESVLQLVKKEYKVSKEAQEVERYLDQIELNKLG